MQGARIPSLDGLRAISILLVFYGHLERTRGFTDISLSAWFGDLAVLGVGIFFIISGFLITSLLVEEERIRGRVSLKQFYLRRFLRIMPAFYVFLAAIGLATALGYLQTSRTDFIAAATYTVNYQTERSWSIGHLWSLSVEEQFYLLWPAVFVLLRQRQAILVSLAMVLIAPMTRLAMRTLFEPGSPWRDLEIFPAVADGIAIGCAMALLRPWLLSQPWYLAITRSGWLWLALPMSLLLNRYSGYTLVDALGSPPKLLCMVVMIEACTRNPGSRVVRLLNLRPIAFIGVLSYSLYLWQQPFLDRHSEAWYAAFPQNVVLAVAFALFSYWLVEKPLLGLRQRLRTTGT